MSVHLSKRVFKCNPENMCLACSWIWLMCRLRWWWDIVDGWFVNITRKQCNCSRHRMCRMIQHPCALLMVTFVMCSLHFHHQRAASSWPIAHEEGLVDGSVSLNVQYLQDPKTCEGWNTGLVQDRYNICTFCIIFYYVERLRVNKFALTRFVA